MASHFGGWKPWDEAEELLIGKEIYLEISFALKYLKEEQVKLVISNHPSDFLLFGTDSPWDNQSQCLQRVKDLSLAGALFEKIRGTHTEKLL